MPNSKLKTHNSKLRTHHAQSHAYMASEIRHLVNFLRQTRRKIADGAIDYKAGATILARLTNSLSTLLLTQNRIPAAPDPGMQYLQDEFARVITALGCDPNDLDL
jgi:hypothetical protein